MSTIYNSIKNIYNDRYSLKRDDNLLDVLRHVQSTFQPGNDLAKLTEMRLMDEPVSCYAIDGVASVSLLKSPSKKIVIIGLEEENDSIYGYLEEMLSKRLDSYIDMFIHYPYSKNKEVTNMLSGSYASKHYFMLDTEGMSMTFPHVRFHYCDLRSELHDGESDDQLKERVKILNIYSDYLVDKDISVFTEKLLKVNASEIDILSYDDRLYKLEGKIAKSLNKSMDTSLVQKMMTWFKSSTEECRTKLLLCKQKLMAEPRFIPAYYLEYMQELNHLYNCVNTLYAMLRMFRSFRTVEYQNSNPASNCIVILPMMMAKWISDFLSAKETMTWNVVEHVNQYPSKISQCTLDQMLENLRY